MSGPHFNSYDVCRMAGITYRQLDYWVRTNLLAPSVPSAGSGTGRRWTGDDVRRAKIVGLLMRSDWRSGLLPSARRLVQELPDMPIDGGYLIVSGAGVSWVRTAAEIGEACGSGAVWVLDLAAVDATAAVA